MYWIRFIIFVLIAAILNAGNLSSVIAIGSANIKPDLLLILLVFIAANSSSFDAIIASFVIGLFADISGSAIGPAMISFGLFGSLISQMRKVIIMKRMVHQAIAIFAIGLFGGCLTQILIFLKTGQKTPNLTTVIFATALYSAVIGPIVWVGLSAVSTWLGVRRFRVGGAPRSEG